MSRTIRPHLIWDWSGTLADEARRHTEALNVALAAVAPAEATRIDMEDLHRLSQVPEYAAYSSALGRPLTTHEHRLAEAALKGYLASQPPAPLTRGASELLRRLVRSGCSHSVVSLRPHDSLIRHIDALGVAALFIRVDGRRTSSAGSTKSQALARHVRAIRPAIDDRPIIVIGDAPDDAVGAAANGLPVVLYAGGFTSVELLRQIGPPVAVTLAEAAAIAVAHAHASPATE
ncbi:HAD family hydrolase [Streptomyces albipurpureus]|uniref:Haloacid dehalogenase-like hydrolase n=1 Tax=Streptomyces albipurpureus TaxID=2897419 RepID=A0ABT0UKR5_9ACTN|nr:HAD family hydrolase [Streptomyces sp. CWNU-1]MCM2388821.1 haloacid dehalogenase-like hydrolase [Streptomyces sp. CWNU-1]